MFVSYIIILLVECCFCVFFLLRLGYDEVDGDRSESKTKSKKRVENPYKNQLMLSEWLVDVPKDFHQNWLMIVCPVGKRCLVIASKGSTTVHSRTGVFKKQFPSNLPGGNYKVLKSYTILDCIYHDVQRVFYVLDLMCWNSLPVYDSDTEFRQYWLQTKLKEAGESLSVASKINPYPFLPTGSFPCTHESLTSVFSSGWSLAVDGLLFLHKQAHYVPGRSPLQAWLKSYMVPEILSMPVSQEFLNSSPAMEVSCKAHLPAKSAKMDVTTEEHDPATQKTNGVSSTSTMDSSSV